MYEHGRKMIKESCKWMVDNRNRNLSQQEKELLKAALDASKNIEELIASGIIGNLMR